MYTIQNNDVIQYTMEYDILSSTCLNVLHYQVTNLTGPYVDGQSLLLEFLASQSGISGMINACTAALASNCTLVRHSAQKVYNLRYVREEELLNLPGTNAGTECTASNVAAVITKLPIIAQKGVVGSFHFPGLPADAYTAGSLTVAYGAFMSSIATRLIVQHNLTVSGALLVPILFRRGPFNAFNPVVSTVRQTTLRVMRRRTKGVGI